MTTHHTRTVPNSTKGTFMRKPGTAARALGWGVTAVLAATLLVATPGAAATGDLVQRSRWSDEQRRAHGAEVAPELEAEVPIDAVPVPGAGDPVPDMPQAEQPSPRWPAASRRPVVVGKAARPAEAMVGVRSDDPRAAGHAVAVEVLDRQKTTKAGVDGLLMRFQHDTAPAPDAVLEVSVDYSDLEGTYGGNWASRLRLVKLPDCALDTPTAPQCRTQTPVQTENDPTTSTVTARVASAELSTMALAAGTSGPTGNFGATTLSPSSSWQVNEQTGDFSWSYPLRTPPMLGGPQPELDLSYSASSVDGKVASTNNQTSWVGDGWDLDTGYIERRYVSCSQDTAGGANNATRKTGDMCWSTDNATVSFAGGSGELVKDATTGNWRMKNDDGARVERLTGGWNDDNDGEYWKITTTDGTQYVFGRGKRAAADTAQTNSAWSMPVFGNHPGEPCYATSFASSSCTQTWRWNLEYVVDTSGNTMTYTYAKETNNYGRNLNTAVSTYVRGGYLTSIDYGQRAGSEWTTPAPGRVDFAVAERCLPAGTITCDPAQLTTANARSWPDVPLDLVCTSATTCPEQTSPAFFTRKRLTAVTTRVMAGTAYQDVDRWTLGHTFPDPGDGTSPVLWLDRIGHQGLVGTPITLPDVRFVGTQMANRVDTLGDLGPPMNRYRVSGIFSEAGGTTSVNYTPQDCASGNVPTAPDANTRRCFPIRWQPEGSGPQVLEYFHKYLVDSVIENPGGSTSPALQTSYRYVDTPAWHYDDNPLTPVADRTWGQFRGYGVVDVITGSTAGQRSQERTRYFRGMHGDKLANGTTRTVAVDGIQDVDRLNGFTRESISYNGLDGPELSGTLTTPWISPPTATGADGTRATYLEPAVTESRTLGSALPGGRRTTRTTTTYDDAYGDAVQVNDQGDTAVATDDQCTRTEYVRNTAAHLVASVRRTETVGVECSVTPARPADVLSDSRTLYDGLAFGAAPTRGLVTATQSLASYSGTSPVYVTDASTTYDAQGRTTSGTDALGRVSTTSYVPSTGGPVTSTSTTAPDPDGTGPVTPSVTTVQMNPAWGSPTTVTDPNGKVTTATFDALGRTTAVWMPDRPKATKSASTTYAYTVSTSGVNTVTTSTITAAETYQTSVALFDGLLRARQTQTPSASRDTPGRLITDTVYDARGLVALEHGEWFATGDPGSTLVTPATAVPTRTRYLYDGAGRETSEIEDVNEQEISRTVTSYDGDRTSVDPPTGATPETSIVDGRGQVVERRHYLGAAPTGTYQTTRYGHDRAGNLTSVRDHAGNTWTYSYDLRGRQTSATDPNKGTTSTTYDNARNPVSTTDARGTTLVQVRDQLDRPVQLRETSTTGTLRASWVYDTLQKGQLTSTTRHVGTAAYTSAVTAYDSEYRPLGESVTIPAAEGALAGTYTTQYAYTPDGQLKATKLPAAGNLATETVSTTFDSTSRPHYMSGGAGWGMYVADTAYDVYGETVRHDLGNTYSFLVNYSYQPGTRRLAQSWVEREGSTGRDMDLTYTYDQSGNPTSFVDRPTGKPVDAQCFRFDGLQRLTTAWTPASADCAATPTTAGLGGPAPYWNDYTFDAAGNRATDVSHAANGDTIRTYAYAGAGQPRPSALTSITQTGPAGTKTSSFGYDAAGNTTTRNVADKPGQTLTWDPEGELQSVTDAATGTSTYVYGASGDRLVRRQGGATTVYLPGGQELTLTAATGALTTIRYYSFGGQTIASRTGSTGSTVTSLVADLHGTGLLSIANVANTVTQRRMDPFGATRGAAAAWVGDHGFLNKPTDASGLTQVGARYYDATIGRFISVDPVMDLSRPQQWGGYSYAENNPVTYADPTGLLSWKKIWKSTKKGAKSAWGSSRRFVRKNQGAIVGYAFGAVVTAGCLAATAGAGSVGCLALGGAAAGAATNLWKSKVQKTKPFSWGRLAKDSAIGAATSRIPGGRALGRLAGGAIKAAARSVKRAGAGVATRASAGARDVAERTRAAALDDRGSIRILPGKPGPKPAGQGPHNIRIKEVADSVTDGRVVAGGARAPEAVIQTPGGVKGSRRPDVLVERPDGTQYGINVGLQSPRSGAPVTREVHAINDLEQYGNLEMHFVPYNKV